MSAVLRPEAPRPSPVTDIKVILLAGILERLVSRYPTQAAAGEALNYDRAMMSRLYSGETDRFSLPWLVALLYRLGGRLRFEVG